MSRDNDLPKFCFVEFLTYPGGVGFSVQPHKVFAVTEFPPGQLGDGVPVADKAGIWVEGVPQATVVQMAGRNGRQGVLDALVEAYAPVIDEAKPEVPE